LLPLVVCLVVVVTVRDSCLPLPLFLIRNRAEAADELMRAEFSFGFVGLDVFKAFASAIEKFQ